MPPDQIFDLRIEQTATGYTLRAESAAVGQLGPFDWQPPFDAAALLRERRSAAEWVDAARQKPTVRRRETDTQRKARELGARLFDALFPADLRAALRVCRDRLDDGAYLRLHLRLPPDLAAFPWELLHDPQQDEFLALAPDLTLVRYPELARPLRPLTVEGALQMVVVLANPAGTAALDLDREQRRIETALRVPIAQGRIALEIIRRRETPDQLRVGTLDQLRARMRRPLHILHILSHGDLDAHTEEGVLLFEDADGADEPVGAELLRRLLEEQRGRTRLVLLNACLGALPGGDDPFSSLAAALVRGGVPAVVAMQFEHADDAAVELARVFYADLADGLAVDVALTRARRYLDGRFPQRLDWLTPVLFLRAEDARLFAPTTQPVTPAPTPPPAPEIAILWRRALVAYHAPRWAEAEALLAQVAAINPAYQNVGERLADARRQLRLAAQYQDALDLAADGEWATVLNMLNELAVQQPGYPDPQGLRERAEREQRRAQRFATAQAAGDRGDWAAAIPLLDAILADFPDDVAAQELRTVARAEQALAEQREQQRQERKRREQMQREQEQLAAERAEQERREQERIKQERAASERRTRYGTIQTHIQAGNHAQALKLLEVLLQERTNDSEALALAAGLIENPAVALEQRLAAARLVGQHGDPRPGVCAFPPAWCAPIPAGEYEIGTLRDVYNGTDYKPVKLRLQSFQIARYPVTVWQYRQFVEAGGYDDPQWWTEHGNPLRKRLWPPYEWDNPTFTAPNQPVSGISWYEAMAFCTWLTAHGRQAGWLRKDQIIRLPTEAEWEVAAAWDAATRRMQPWNPPAGEIWQNVKEAGIGVPSPVGLFPQGVSPNGALDMAGNVWEWCASPWNGFPGTATQQPPDYPSGEIGPALRGGSYYLQHARSGWGARFRHDPYDLRVSLWGVRCVVCSAAPLQGF